MSRRTFIRTMYHFLGIKTLDCMYENRLMCLIRNCDASNVELIRLFQTLCTTRAQIQSICYKYDVHANMSVDITKSKIALFCRDSAAEDTQSILLLFFN